MKSLFLSLLVVCPLVAQTQLSARAAVPDLRSEANSAGVVAGLPLIPSAEIVPVVSSTYSLPRERSSVPRDRGLFAASVAALAAANAADLATSWGRREANPFLASSNTRFGPQAAVLKVGFTGVSLLIQWIALRHNSRLHRGIAYTNFAVAGGISAVAIRNTSVPR